MAAARWSKPAWRSGSAARAALFLAGLDSAFVTSAELVVDGGLTQI
jgi:NAD(P)-dependent dehydrogenase (short-subunit alcohol dehydrogenase family)